MAQPIRIQLDALGSGTVEINGHNIAPTIRSVAFAASSDGSLPTLTVDVVTRHGMTIETQADIVLGPNLVELLADLGWTSPDDQIPL